jgi:hypothetical protein
VFVVEDYFIHMLSEGHSEFSFLSFQAQLTDALDELFYETRREQIQVILKKLDYETEKARPMIRQTHENVLKAHNGCCSSFCNILECRPRSPVVDSPSSS